MTKSPSPNPSPQFQEKPKTSYAFPLHPSLLLDKEPEPSVTPSSSRKRTRSGGKKTNPSVNPSPVPILIHEDEGNEENEMDAGEVMDESPSREGNETTSHIEEEKEESGDDNEETVMKNGEKTGDEKGNNSSDSKTRSENRNENEESVEGESDSIEKVIKSIGKETQSAEKPSSAKASKGKGSGSQKKVKYLGCNDPVTLSGKWDHIAVQKEIEESTLSQTVKTNCKRLIFKDTIHTPRVWQSSWWTSDSAFLGFEEAVKAQGFEDIIQMDEPTYASEVIQFYATVHVNSNLKSLSAKVNGKSFTASTTYVAKLLNLHNLGYDGTPSGKIWPVLEYASPTDIARTLNPINPQCHPVFPNTLPALPKLLSNLLCRTLYPSDDRAKLNVTQQYLIYHLVTHRQINLPSLMFKRFAMVEAKLHDPAYTNPIRLPYGMWISVLLRAKGVLVKESMGCQGMFDYMSTGNLGKMLLKTDQGRLFSVKNAKGKEVEKGSPSKMGEVTVKVDNTEVLDALAEIKSSMARKEDVAKIKSLKADLEFLKSAVDLLKGDVSIISTLMGIKVDDDTAAASDEEGNDDLAGF